MDALGALAERHGLWLARGRGAGDRRAPRRPARRAPSAVPAASRSTRRRTSAASATAACCSPATTTLAATCATRPGTTASSRPTFTRRSGLCSRLDAVQAAALGAKLPHLDGWNGAPATRGGLVRDAFPRRAGLPVVPGAPVALPAPRGRSARVSRLHRPGARRDALRACTSPPPASARRSTTALPLHRQPPLAACARDARRAFREAERAAARRAGAADVSADVRGAGGARRRGASRRSTVRAARIEACTDAPGKIAPSMKAESRAPRRPSGRPRARAGTRRAPRLHRSRGRHRDRREHPRTCRRRCSASSR